MFVLGPETSDQDRRAFTKRFGVPLIQGYGSSENAIIIQPAPRGHRRARSAWPAMARTSRWSIPIRAWSAHGPASTRTAGCSTPGRRSASWSAATSATGSRGTTSNDEAEAERTRNGWYWSGDLVYRDEDGVFYFAGRSGDWLRVDSENFAAAPIERILQRYEPVQGVAVYPVPDSRTGDQVMAALEIPGRTGFDADGFATFLADQPDLGTKWAPRYVRIVDALPVTGTDKLDKKPLRSAALGHRRPDLAPRPRGPPATCRSPTRTCAALRQEFEENGRQALFDT